jgi:hypothetical protein
MMRVQRKRTKGWRMPPNTVYVGRPSKWGNPYAVGKLSDDAKYPVTAAQAVAFYDRWLHTPGTQGGAGARYRLQAMVELHGKNLCCWCPPNQPCHADVLLEIASR